MRPIRTIGTNRFARMPSRGQFLARLLPVVLVASGFASTNAALAPAVVHASTTTVHLRVESARDWNPAGLHIHQPIPVYQWLITKDDVGNPARYGATNPDGTPAAFGPGNSYYDCTPQRVAVKTPDGVTHAAGTADPDYPANCQWPSIMATPGGTTAQVVAQGDQTNFSEAVGLTECGTTPTLGCLPDGNYMISVTADGFDVPGCLVTATVTCHVDGFKVDGGWFSMPAADTGLVTVALQPYPLPLATIRARVWNDLQTNGAYDDGEPTLAGFTAKLSDIGGIVSDDWFGNPICTTYQHDGAATTEHPEGTGNMVFDASGKPVVYQLGGKCLSDSNGDIVIPYMPPQRYSVEVIPPAGQTWYQTTTLEGWHDWDTWAIQGWNGFDPEFVVGGEPFPFAEFGFVQTQACKNPAANPSPGQRTFCPGPNDTSVPLTGTAAMTGKITGKVIGTTAVSPAVGGLPLAGAQGNIVLGPINQPLLSLVDTNQNDNTVWVGRGLADGSFQINHVPDSDYVLYYWDEDQSYLLTGATVSIRNGQVVDMGDLDAAAWWGNIHGRVCFDANRNGKCDPGEQGIPGLKLNLLGRDNSLQPSGDNSAATDSNGDYSFPRAYPLGQFVVEQGYWEQFYTVGVTYQSINQSTETTQMANGGFVDISTLNAIGMNTRVDWAVHTYETNPALGPTTGGIVGEMYYNNIQIESDGRFQTIQPSEPGIPGFNVHLYWPVKCSTPTTDGTATPTDPAAFYTPPPGGADCTLETTPFGSNYYLTSHADGSMVHGAEAADPYTSETWQRPQDCVARDADGNVVQEQVLPPIEPNHPHDCLEAPLMESQVSNNADTGVGMTVNGNYGFTQISTDVHGVPIGARPSPSGLNAVESTSPGSLAPATYIYEVTATDASGETTPSAPASVTTTATDSVSLTWSAVPGATGYKVYGRPATNSGPFGLLASGLTSTTFTDDGSATPGAVPPTTNTSGTQAPITIPAGDWIVAPESPKDINGNAIWRPSLEEDVNGYTGDEMVAPGETPTNPPTPAQPAAQPTTGPAIVPFACVGPLHTVDVVDSRAAANFDLNNPSTTQGIYNPGFLGAENGGPFQGTQKPLCDAQLVTVRNGRSATPNFSWIPQTWVPLPARIFGLVVDDLNLSVNPRELFFGEKYGIPNLPIGIYDFSNRLIKTVNTDPNGMFQVELPSTTISDCPSPASVCPGMYRYLANDPGQPGSPNPNYNPSYRTIGAFFEAWPGISGPADLAPVPSAMTIELPGTTTSAPAQCLINDPTQPTAPKIPDLYSINRPYMLSSATGIGRQFVLKGLDFGAAAGRVTLDGSPMNIVSWADHNITFAVPASFAVGAHQLRVTNAGGLTTINGLTFHIIGGAYNPTVFEVGPGRTGLRQFNATNNPHAIQQALNAAASSTQALVVVYPNTPTTFNALGTYFENVIIHSPVKLQGVGPGGVYANSNHVQGTVLDGTGFGTDSQRDTDWAAQITALGTIAGTAAADLPEGEVILAVKSTPGPTYTSAYTAAIDGLTVQGGDVGDFTANFNNVGNGPQVFEPVPVPGVNQGGGIVAFNSTPFLHITNNIIKSNTGAYGGAIRLGTPTVGGNNLGNIHIANNRITNNGGANLAGAVAVFAGSNNYEINGNDICGNFSAEYGGGISHFGLSPNSSIHDNHIYFNGSYDEGAGVMIAGEPPLTPTGLSAGAGAVNVYNNVIQSNLANDDGGGLRFLSAGNFPFNVYNNFIVNNISTHEGGGVAIDNAPNVRFYNNTVMKNITTATSATSNGQPAPAGLSTSENNAFLQATLPAGSPPYSNPLLFNNIFWDNRAGTWDPAAGMVRGIGQANLLGVVDSSPLNHWDMGVPGTGFLLSPTNSVLQSGTGTNGSATNVFSDPLVVSTFDTTIATLPWRGNPNFIANVIVAQDVPFSIMGNYHLSGTGSSAYNAGAASKAVPSYQQPPATLAAPTFDIDNGSRPTLGGFDSGADELPPPASADLSITKDDGVTAVVAGGTITYTIMVSNAGPSAAPLAPVTDTYVAPLTGGTWSCTATAGSTCGAASGSGNISTTVTLAVGGSATFTSTATVSGTATGTFANTATVAAPAGIVDPNAANNSATDSDSVVPALPTLPVLDNFNRTNANTLGSNWSQTVLAGSAGVRVNTNQAFCTGLLCLIPGQAIWNGATNVFGARQGAAFTFATAPVDTTALVLKASGGTLAIPANFIRVQYAAGTVAVATTNTAGLTTNVRATFTAAFASGDRLTAVALADGTVNVYRTTGATTTAIGSVLIPTTGTGAWTQGAAGGRIGFQLPSGARVDDFRGATVP